VSDRRKLALVGLAALLVRVALVLATPDVDTDAYGHFAIGRALLADPRNLQVHWVWLPGYHYLIWALAHLGVGFTGVRLLSALLQAAAPFLLYDLVARRGDEDPERSRPVALLAALTWTLAPITNRLATSAQAETFFTLLIVGSAWAVERRRAWLAGGLLAAACLVRYEAWGAIPALALYAFARRREPPVGLAAALLPAAAVLGWIALRRVADGSWLRFVHETHAFASGVRAAQEQASLAWRVGLSLVLPFRVLGPAVVLVPIGLRRSLRIGWLVPGGVLAFVLASYLGHGALGLERYLDALVPFACVAIADGVVALGEMGARVRRGVLTRAVLVATALTTAAHLGWMVHRAREREGLLRGYEAEAGR
jgi:hypothetical protein